MPVKLQRPGAGHRVQSPLIEGHDRQYLSFNLQSDPGRRNQVKRVVPRFE
jgi:hypothetical protein